MLKEIKNFNMNNFDKRGSYVSHYPIKGNSKLKPLVFSGINRETDNKGGKAHIAKMKRKIGEFGWCDVIKIAPSGVIIEGQHRVKAAIDAKELSVPAIVLDWLGEDEEQIRAIIIGLNNGNQEWKLNEYCNTFKSKKDSYKIISENIDKYTGVISNGVIYTIFTGKKTLDKDFKNGKLGELKKPELSNKLLIAINDLISKHGKKNFPAQTVRSLASCCFKEESTKFVDYFINRVILTAKGKNYPPDGDSDFVKYYNDERNQYIKYIQEISVE